MTRPPKKVGTKKPTPTDSVSELAADAIADDQLPESRDRQDEAEADHAALADDAIPSEPAFATATPRRRAARQTGPEVANLSLEGDGENAVAIPELPVGEPAVDPAAPQEPYAESALRTFGYRAFTEVAELRARYQKLDGLVIIFAVAVVVSAAYLHRRLVRPPTQPFTAQGLTFARATTWLPPESVPNPAPRLVRDLGRIKPNEKAEPYRVAFSSSVDSSARLEVLVDDLPAWSNLVTGLELDRRTRWGELYRTIDSSVRSIAGHDWLRTTFDFAYAAERGESPSVGRALEYATIDRSHLYVITLMGRPRTLAELDATITPSLRVASRSGMPLLPQVGPLSRQQYPEPVAAAFSSTVMVVVADLQGGQLRARGGGSGIVVGNDGSILTNYHVIHDSQNRVHDVFIIGRYVGVDKPPELLCAGRPGRAKLEREVDLALLKCDLDLDGRAWPANAGRWRPLTGSNASSAALRSGSRLWVLGYPDVGGGGLTLSQGVVEGMTGEDGGLGADYIKTDAAITHGNSGGPVLDDSGNLVGIATGFRVRMDVSGGTVEISKPGLVRPLSAAFRLMAWASTGWVPCDGCSDARIEPTDIEAAAEGIMISTTIRNADNSAPVLGASLLVLRPGVSVDDIDMNRLGDSVIASGRSNADGEVHLRQPVPTPGTYGVIVVAPGYHTLASNNALVLTAEVPPYFDPWTEIRIKAE